MKKIFIAILTVLYMAVSSGIAMDVHYCMGKKIGFDLYGNDDGTCGKCGMKHKKGCCGDEHKFYKLSDSHNIVFNTINFCIPVVAVANEYPYFYCRYPDFIASSVVTAYSPPDYTQPPARILNCTFRV
jgi:hypothetical protein